MRPHILLGTALLYLCMANVIWILNDSRPPFWDMAYHQAKAIQVYDAVRSQGLAGLLEISHLTGFYPPLFHSVVAIFFALSGKSIHSGAWANLPAIAILLFATYGLGKRLLAPGAAAIGAVLVSFFPLMLWLSREALLDYWLAALVTLAMLCLYRTENFSKRSESFLFGLVCGLGMLTKWTFPLFLAFPAIWAARKNWKNASIAALTAAVVSAFWYLPQWSSLSSFFNINQAGGVAEGDPSKLSLQALVFYIRALEGYQLFLPLFVLFLAGAFLMVRRFSPAWIPIILWMTSGWCGLLLFQNKDPRYTVPLLPAVALISATVFHQKRIWFPVLAGLLLVQHYMVSFGIRHLPERVVLLQGIQGPLSWDWNLYTQTYFQIWGPPAREDWKIEHVLARTAAIGGPTVKIGIIPSIARFDPEAFEFYGTLRKYNIVIARLLFFNEAELLNQDYILMSEGDQGFAAFSSQDLDRINRYIMDRPGRFQMIDRFTIPSGQTIRLYQLKS
jgi:4-amino-4-deoxy-L-arabinose transferase-like glycosyltransferase